MAQSGTAGRQAERSRHAILDAATELFARDGYGATTLQRVGQRAGLSRGTPAYFFGSKEELYEAVLARAIAEAKGAMLAAAHAADAEELGEEEAFRRSIGAYIDFLAGHPEFIRLVQWEALGGGRTLRDAPPHVEMVQAALGALGDTLSASLPPGFDTTQLMLSVVGLCWFPLAQGDTLGAALGFDHRDRAFLRARKEHVVELVFWGIRGASRSKQEEQHDG
jgi:TetR/AcrR family transcriptional regulator